MTDEQLKQLLEEFHKSFRHQIKTDIGEFVRIDVTEKEVTFVGKENSRVFERNLLEIELEQLNRQGMFVALRKVNQ